MLHLSIKAFVKAVFFLVFGVVLLRKAVMVLLLEGSSELLIFHRIVLPLLLVEHVPAGLLVLEHEVEVLLLLLL